MAIISDQHQPLHENKKTANNSVLDWNMHCVLTIRAATAGGTEASNIVKRIMQHFILMSPQCHQCKTFYPCQSHSHKPKLLTAWCLLCLCLQVCPVMCIDAGASLTSIKGNCFTCSTMQMHCTPSTSPARLQC